MRERQSLSHTKWNCKYPIVFIPKRGKISNIWKLTKAPWAILLWLSKTESLWHSGGAIVGATLVIALKRCQLNDTTSNTRHKGRKAQRAGTRPAPTPIRHLHCPSFPGIITHLNAHYWRVWVAIRSIWERA